MVEIGEGYKVIKEDEKLPFEKEQWQIWQYGKITVVKKTVEILIT